MDANTRNAIIKMITEVNAKIRSNEYNTVSIKGVKNLSRADLEEIVFFGEQLLATNGTLQGLMAPLGNVRALLEKYDVYPLKE